MMNRTIPLLLLLMAASLAQNNHPNLPTPAADSQPTVSFTLDWASADPPHYSLKVDASGDAAYESARPGADATVVNFSMSPVVRRQVFDLAAQANYFQGDFDFHKHKIANTGSKVLMYDDSSRHASSTYNWSENQSIQQLTEIFRSIADTIEGGQRLAYLRRFDKLGLERQLQQMDAIAEEGHLRELQVIAPVLQQIASDASVMEIARQHARNLLRLGAP